MDYYFSEKDYLVWVRPYELILTNFMTRVDALRIDLSEAPPEVFANNPELTQKIFAELNLIEEKLNDAVPRDFTKDQKPLTRGEMFGESVKIIINALYKQFNLAIPFKGIYQSEKERVEKADRDFDFKKHVVEVVQMVDQLLAPSAQTKDREDTAAETTTPAAKT